MWNRHTVSTDVGLEMDIRSCLYRVDTYPLERGYSSTIFLIQIITNKVTLLLYKVIWLIWEGKQTKKIYIFFSLARGL